ncbi:MAG: DUF4239 domain-containing protein [Gammaproteobacteria bacterium]|nr:DUF4239 domain-containing protein [Gammaproteobacteria bacterium]
MPVNVVNRIANFRADALSIVGYGEYSIIEHSLFKYQPSNKVLMTPQNFSPAILMLGAGALTVAAVTAVAMAGQLVMARLIPLHRRCAHNHVLGPASSAASTIYAVLLAFIASTAWTSYNQARSIVGQEAAQLADLYSDTEALPEPARSQITANLRIYARDAVEDEWPAMAEKQESYLARWRVLNRIRTDLLRVEPVGPAATYVVGEMLRLLTGLYDARRLRLSIASHGSLHPLVWSVVLLGGVVIFIFCWLFGAEEGRLHLTSTGLVGVCLGLVVYLIVGLNHPFRGPGAVTAKPLKSIAEFMDRTITESPPQVNRTTIGSENKTAPSGTVSMTPGRAFEVRG